jgi:parallel beta-helix repeat protein
MRRASGLSVTVLATVVLAATSARATTINVPGDYGTIQEGVDAAQAGDTVFVGVGTFDDLHYPPADTTQCVVYMKSGITLRGSGQGQTVIDALHGGRGIHCFGVSNARIEDMTITNAFADTYGAGIYCEQSSSPTITSCEVTECYDGGIITNFNSSPDISYCEMTDNVGKLGAGIAMEDFSSPTVTHCTISGNSAPVAGGVYVKTGCAPVFEHCVIDTNSLNTVNGKGGAIVVDAAQITLRNCTVNQNVSTGAGGGIYVENESFAVIESTTVQNNTSGGELGPGGGIYCQLSDMDLDYCTITGNTAAGDNTDGGGVYIFFTTTTTFTNCTIANNSVNGPDSLGGGISLALASPVIEKSIIAFNGPGKGLRCDPGSSPIVSCSDIYGNAGGDLICGTDVTGNFSQDPLFCNMSADHFTLAPGSPCLPGNHPSGAPCGLIGAHGGASCPTGVPETGVEEPALFVTPPYASPNPFRANGVIRFGIGRPGNVSLTIYDVRGRRVRLLVDDRLLGVGDHEIVWDARDDAGRDVASGVYFCKLGGSRLHQIGRLVLRR